MKKKESSEPFDEKLRKLIDQLENEKQALNKILKSVSKNEKQLKSNK